MRRSRRGLTPLSGGCNTWLPNRPSIHGRRRRSRLSESLALRRAAAHLEDAFRPQDHGRAVRGAGRSTARDRPLRLPGTPAARRTDQRNAARRAGAARHHASVHLGAGCRAGSGGNGLGNAAGNRDGDPGGRPVTPWSLVPPQPGAKGGVLAATDDRAPARRRSGVRQPFPGALHRRHRRVHGPDRGRCRHRRGQRHQLGTGATVPARPSRRAGPPAVPARRQQPARFTSRPPVAARSDL